jgi:hypothetical protein
VIANIRRPHGAGNKVGKVGLSQNLPVTQQKVRYNEHKKRGFVGHKKAPAFAGAFGRWM